MKRDPFFNVIHGDALEILRLLPPNSVQCVVTSPPYLGLRNYETPGQIGLEQTPQEYIARLVEVCREIHRILRPDGTLWINLGDSYVSSATGSMGKSSSLEGGQKTRAVASLRPSKLGFGIKEKNLIGIPWRVAFALQEDGWYLRSDIIWHKPNSMPESVTDRPAKAHEYVFLLTKSPRYFYDTFAVREPEVCGRKRGPALHPCKDTQGNSGLARRESTGFRNRRSVWTINTKPFKEAHFAVFPESLVEPCILAGTSEAGACAECGTPLKRIIERLPTGYDGSTYGERAVAATGGAISGGTAKSTLGSSHGKLTAQYQTTGWKPSCSCGTTETIPCLVLDPFCGSGTTGVVAKRFGRSFVGIDLNANYCEMARKRIAGAEEAESAEDSPIIQVEEAIVADTKETLEEVRRDLGDCQRCELAKTRRNLVFGSGNPHADLMIVGEAPGESEDVIGEPFVGRAGQELMKWLAAMDLNREQVYIANVLKCRPPNNRTPFEQECDACLPFLRRQIAAVAPKVILALGTPAIQSLLPGKGSISQVRGQRLEYEGVPLIGTYHPSAVLRDRRNKLADVVNDLGVLVKILYDKKED